MRAALARVGLGVLGAGVVSVIAWPAYGGAAALETFEILAPVGAVTTLLASVVASEHGLPRSLRGRLAVVAVLAVAQLAAALALMAARMFVSTMDAFFMALAAGYAVLVGLGAARLLARRALRDLGAVHEGLAAVGGGARSLDIEVASGAELAQLAAGVEAMVERVGAEEQARRQLVAAVSHDLRTPITTLQLVAEGLSDDIFEPERAREQLRLISTHVRALGALIEDLFELSRLEAGDVQWSVQQVHLDELVRETIDAMRPQAEAEGVAVRAELEQPLSAARGNPEQLQRVLFNLIQNAIRHTPADGSVVVRAERRDGGAGLEVEVADSGSGIEPALRERIFEPFVQGPARVAGQTGSAGLGLAIARAIVEAHGGRIWVAPSNSGAHIRFSLPAA